MIVLNSPTWTGPQLTAPHLHSESKDTITSYDPSNGLHIASYPSLSSSQVKYQVSSATRASKTWSKTTFAQRRQVLRSLYTWIIDNKESIAQVCVRDTGKTMVDASLGEVLTTLEKLRWMIEYGEHYLKPDKRA
jgi:acyl-CoA reductase-like NAD-dependent aldehyde dehydrogenase